MAERFLVGSYQSGLMRDKKPFLIPDEAFETLRNAYVFRERVKKRFGSRVMNTTVDQSVQQLYTRFRIDIGMTDGAGNFAGTVPVSAPNTPIATPAIGQLFSVGDGIFTVNVLGNPAALLSTTSASATYDTTTGAVTITGADPNTEVYFFPGLPVMGLITREVSALNNEELIGFDTRFAYSFNTGTQWEQIPGTFWTGSDTDFFWGANYRGATDNVQLLFVTNFTNDGIYYFNAGAFTSFTPVINSANGDRLISGLIIIPFQSRLLVLNTIEEVAGVPTAFANRCRFSQNGSPIAAEAWYSPPTNFGRGDFIDCPTSEAIVSALILKDRLIVTFERSTWELAYTNNQVVPFVWQNINIELGCESTFSLVPFDTALLYVGDVGIHACNGANVERIDLQIPDEIFEVDNDQDGPQRVYGVRDYSIEMVYWAFPDEQGVATTTYPSKVLVYNYRNNTWSINDDSITAFGQYQIQTSLTWNSTHLTWAELDAAWDDGVNQRLARNVIAGNQEGFTFIVDHNSPINAHAISITDITESSFIAVVTAINHNLNSGDFVLIDFVTSDNDPDSTITDINDKVYSVFSITPDTFAIQVTTQFAFGATYSGGGTFRRVSQIQIKTKQYNFYLDQAISFSVNKIDMLMDTTAQGEITINVYPNTGNLITDSSIMQTSPYSDIYAPMEQYQSSVWHTVYPNSYGAFMQFEITLSEAQMLDKNIADADFVMNAMVFNADATAFRLQ